MGFSNKYRFEELSYGTVGWNAILEANFDLTEQYLQTYLRYQVASGETISSGEFVCIHDEKFKLALANGVRQPAVGITIESGVSGEYIRAQRCGAYTNAGWNLAASGEVWLSDSVQGGIRQTAPASNAQVLGCAIAQTKVLVQL